MVKKDVVSPFQKTYGNQKRQPRPNGGAFKAPTLTQLWDPSFRYINHMDVQEKKIGDRIVTYFKPTLNIQKIREDFEKEPNTVSKITLPAHHSFSPTKRPTLRAAELYFFPHRPTGYKTATVFFSTSEAFPIPYYRAKSLSLERTKTIHVPTLIDVEKKDLMVIGYTHPVDKNKRVLIYQTQELHGFPSDHPTVTPEQGKHTGFVNMLIKAVTVVSNKGEVKDQWIGTQNNPLDKSIVDCLVGEAIHRLSDEEIYVFREVFGPCKDNLKHLTHESSIIQENQVHPDDFVSTIIYNAKAIQGRAKEDKEYRLFQKGGVCFYLTHCLADEGLIESTAYFQFPVSGEKYSIKTYYESAEPQYLPQGFNDIENIALLGGRSPEDFGNEFPQEYSLLIKL